MSDLNQALIDIRSIRQQVAGITEFRGYGPATLYGTSILALLAGAAQYRLVPSPALQPSRYVALWLTTAVLSAVLIATQMLTRAHRLHSEMADEMVRAAVTQFLPAGLAGAVLPFLLLRVRQDVLWMLPGLWQIIFSLGVFASCRCLPKRMVLAGVWFLVAGLVCMWVGDDRTLAPATMVIGYAPGMAFVAAVQYRSAKKVVMDEDQD